MNILLLLIKGRNLKESLIFLKNKNILIKNNLNNSRSLYLKTIIKNLYILIIKNSDFKYYLNRNCFDFKLIGEDMIINYDFNNFYSYKILKMNVFFLSIISNKNYKFKKKNYSFSSKYLKLLIKYLNFKNLKNFKLNLINGSSENSCILKKSKFIFDILSSGKTIRNNKLFEIKKIINLNCYIIYNKNLLYNKIFNYMENNLW